MPQQLKLGENHIIAMADMVNGDCFTPPSVLKIKFTHVVLSYDCLHLGTYSIDGQDDPAPVLALWIFDHCFVFGAMWLVTVVNVLDFSPASFKYSQVLIGWMVAAFIIPRIYKDTGSCISFHR